MPLGDNAFDDNFEDNNEALRGSEDGGGDGGGGRRPLFNPGAVSEWKHFGDISRGSDGNNDAGGAGEDAAAAGGSIVGSSAGSGSARGWSAREAGRGGRMSFLKAMRRISIGSRKQ